MKMTAHQFGLDLELEEMFCPTTNYIIGMSDLPLAFPIISFVAADQACAGSLILSKKRGISKYHYLITIPVSPQAPRSAQTTKPLLKNGVACSYRNFFNFF